jgi:hypothetical protein
LLRNNNSGTITNNLITLFLLLEQEVHFSSVHLNFFIILLATVNSLGILKSNQNKSKLIQIIDIKKLKKESLSEKLSSILKMSGMQYDTSVS